MKFTKMHGIGNDYIYLDCVRGPVPEDPALLARKVSDRHCGIGGDGLVLILPGDEADFRMRMFNADGSEAEMCGNASRCVGKYLYERGLTDRTEITLETGGGVRLLCLNLREGKVDSVRVDMGVPVFQPEKIPVLAEKLGLSPEAEEAVHGKVTVRGRDFEANCVSVGNPHCVVFLQDVENWPIEEWGPLFEHHPAFPARINTEFTQILDSEHIRMRVWERGSGETMACGTGACATLAAAARLGLTGRKAILNLNGGDLEIEWDEKTGHLWMTGPAEFVFEGEYFE